jgi:5-methylcytosine-specific restriction endonuclease McrA
MDMVEAAGIDVSDWANFKGKHPASNPRYCYEWVFSSSSVVAACLWHSGFEVLPTGQIGQRVNLWHVARKYEHSGSKSVVATRARSLDRALQTLHHSKAPLRVIVVDGDEADLAAQSEKSSRVLGRRLDSEPWHVAAYDFNTGDCIVARGLPRPKFADQFDESATSAAVERTQRTSNVYSRSPTVRLAVLGRAGGKCELCGDEGFLTADGAIYLETHHVVPLSEGGEDSTSNVVALCPSHHREAHFGRNASQIASQLTQYLQGTSN